MQSQHDVCYRQLMSGDLVCRLLVLSNMPYCETLRGIMKKTSITLLGMAVVLALSACQNGVMTTPFGDYGVKSRDGNRVTIGFINKKAPQFGSNTKTVAKAGKPKIVMPEGFNGYWVAADNLKDRGAVCRGTYIGDSGAHLNIDAKNNAIDLGFYEEGALIYWTRMQQHDLKRVSGQINYLYQGQGDGEVEPMLINISMQLINNGKELVAKNLVGENQTTTFLRCHKKQ